MDIQGSDRPERRTAFVGKELDRYNLDIIALSETRLSETGIREELDSGYTFFGRVDQKANVVKQQLVLLLDHPL